LQLARALRSVLPGNAADRDQHRGGRDQDQP
jgi:hypothetical protein